MEFRCSTAPQALHTLAGELLAGPHAVVTDRRGGAVREFDEPVTLTLDHPRNRLSAVFGRGLDPWVSLAEFPWLIAGRNDVAWLQFYLPRAATFADDGLLWRAGYGPRMRNWCGLLRNTDQLAECVARLAKDPGTRQAVISLWEPESDNEEGSKDYPCSNWLHFQRNARTGALDLHVVMRSNDLWWGLSGVNLVNFTLLQELVAACLGWPLGVYRHTADNLHLYERHWLAANALRPLDLYTWATPRAMSIFPAAGPLQKLAAFTNDCRHALDFVTERREDERAVAPEELTALRVGAWLQDWILFMLARGPVRAGRPQCLTALPRDWRAAGVMAAPQLDGLDRPAVYRLLGAPALVANSWADALRASGVGA
jgi:hypothetical protein